MVVKNYYQSMRWTDGVYVNFYFFLICNLCFIVGIFNDATRNRTILFKNLEKDFKKNLTWV